MIHKIDEYTVSYLPFDTSTIEDKCGLTYKAYGKPKIVEKDRFENCLYLNGSSYIKLNKTLPLGGKDLTVDCFMYMIDDNYHYNTLFDCFVTIDNRIAVYHLYRASEWCISSIASGDDQNIEVKYNQWYHIAYCYVHEESTWYTWLDGKKVMEKYSNKDRGNFNVYIGYEPANHYWHGYVSDFRISDGIARWKTEFDPEKELFSSSINDDL